MGILVNDHSLLHLVMAPINASSANNVLLTSSVTFTTKKCNFLTRCSIPQQRTKLTFPAQKYSVPLSTSIRLFPHFRIGCTIKPKLRAHIASASGTDVAVEEANLSPADNDDSAAGVQAAETDGESSAKLDVAPIKSKRPKIVRKSDVPPVKNEDLIPGAAFTGKVRSIQPFGAFVDFGAFTDGLVHVSRLSDSFVRDVASVVTVGQEVTVRLIEANMETGRISLSMRESDDPSAVQQQRDAPGSSDKSRPPRKTGPKFNQKRDDSKKTSKFVKGQDLEGTVKNTTRSGAFISLPEGEEGFLPTSEEANEGFGNIMGGSSLEIGQEVSVRVLRFTRGQVTLTMKKEEEMGELDAKLSQGVVHTATNPFVLAFRSNKDISEFLDKRENESQLGKNVLKDSVSMRSKTDDTLSKTNEKGEDQETIPGASRTDDESGSIKEVEANSIVLANDGNPSTEDQMAEEPSPIEALVTIENSKLSWDSDPVVSTIDDTLSETMEKDDQETLAEDSRTDDDESQHTDEVEASSVVLVDDGSQSTEDQTTEELSPIEAMETKEKSEVSGEVADLSTTIVEEAKDEAGNDAILEDEVQLEKPGEPFPSASLSDSEDPVSATEDEAKSLVSDETLSETSEILTSNPSDDIIAKETEADGTMVNNEGKPLTDQASPDIPDIVGGVTLTKLEDQSEPSIAQVQDVIDANKIGSIGSSNVQSGSSNLESKSTAAISPALVKELREETGAGMMDCKKALSETGGDLVKALEYLRKKGLASADKKASRVTAEGRIGSYIHDSRIGVLIEVNCETDFVSRGDIFRELVEDLAMQVAACPQVQYLSVEDVPKEIVDKEKEIEMKKEDLLSKPEQIRSKIVDGRVNKRLEELALLEQPFIKDDKIVVKDWVKQTISTIGENIKVQRFVRYNLGEGLEKKTQDFAAEVAAQTAAKPSSISVKQGPAAADTKDTESLKTIVSAALVKQLREESGAGMMDCKKALAETGGNLQEAQEYLRKKGLSTADKKSSRLAAEGRIGSYIHDSRIGVLIEINCETDFVGRGPNLKELVDDLAMQVVACPQVQYVLIEDIPEDIVNKEKELEMQRDDILSKPENIREKIVEGRVKKRLAELALLEQPFIKDDLVLVKDLVKQTIATLGENIKVRRFVRFTLGEAAAKSGNGA